MKVSSIIEEHFSKDDVTIVSKSKSTPNNSIPNDLSMRGKQNQSRFIFQDSYYTIIYIYIYIIIPNLKCNINKQRI